MYYRIQSDSSSDSISMRQYCWQQTHICSTKLKLDLFLSHFCRSIFLIDSFIFLLSSPYLYFSHTNIFLIYNDPIAQQPQRGHFIVLGEFYCTIGGLGGVMAGNRCLEGVRDYEFSAFPFGWKSIRLCTIWVCCLISDTPDETPLSPPTLPLKLIVTVIVSRDYQRRTPHSLWRLAVRLHPAPLSYIHIHKHMQCDKCTLAHTDKTARLLKELFV